MQDKLQPSIGRVLIVHPFGIGDALFLTPVIRALRSAGAEKIDLVLGSRTRAIFQNNPRVDEIFVIDRDKQRNQSFFLTAVEIVSFLQKLHENRYDILFDFSLGRHYALAAQLIGIKTRVGFDYKNRGIFLTHKVALPNAFSGKHVVEFYLDLLRAVSIETASRELEYFLKPEDEKEAKQLLENHGLDPGASFITVVPGGGESWGKDARLKRWPASYFYALISEFEKTRALSFDAVFLLGGESEWELAETLRQFAPVKIFNFCGRTSLGVSAALLKQSRLLIANDSGLVHLASALGTKTVALFGPVDPAVYGPYPKNLGRLALTNDGPECRPCYQNMWYNAQCEHVNCLNQLDPHRVFEMVKASGILSAPTSISPSPEMIRK